MAQKPSIPKGTRDFTPSEMIRRNYIFDTIKSVFQLYGFQSIETPSIENLSTLMGKYGEEGDKLLFKILNSGNFLSKIDDKDLIEKNHIKLTNKISEKGLRYDLTVPFARYVVQHSNDISFPFKRYQIQPVWRADRPQKGRYREFYQCDVDIIGSKSLFNEFELVQIADDVFNKLNINTVLKINNRKILAGIAEIIGEKERITDITVAIDKLDKIGIENVNSELLGKGISSDAIKKLQPILNLEGNTTEKINQLKEILKDSEIGNKGIEELSVLFHNIESVDFKMEIQLDIALARGLNYYTGSIFEVKSKDTEIGSITGGGRYDNLTGIFGMPGISGVGISFGADRIYDVMNQLELFPKEFPGSSKVIFINFGEKEQDFCTPILRKLRQANIASEMYPDADKIKKQMKWANRKDINYVVIAGEQEIEAGKVILKNMKTGDQQLITPQQLISILSR
ncbi:MAG: histidine--tRNA ligase [Prolixibacteraceae bacterium]|nr:histidine--tRNA ligase [Prolixibacteraceae bacterium]